MDHGISVAGLPQGATYSTTPFPNGGYGSTLTANVPAGVAPGTYQLTVTASGVSPAGCISGCANATHSEIVILTVSGGQGFTISATPTSSQPVAQGGSAAFNVSVGSVNNYNGSVQLTASGGPPGSVITLNGITGAAGAPVTATLGVASSTSMSVATPAGAGPGTYSISLSAVANGVSKTASTSVTIAAAPAPASIVSPMPGSIPAGTATFTWNAGTGATEYTFAISGANGYSYPATTTTAQSITVPSIPASASPLTVTLQSLTGGIWGSQTYLYSIPSTTVTLSLGTVTVRKNGQAATINSPLTGNDTITGCSAVPGGTTSVSQTGWSPSQQAISLTAGPTSQIGPNPFSCTSQQGWTMDGVLGIDDDPDFTITSATQDPGSGAWNLTLTANYQDGFGDMPGLVQIPGAQVSVTWGGDQIMVVAQVTSCNSYDVKVILAEPGEFSILEGDGPPEADESIDMCPLTPPPPASYTISGVVTAPNGKPLAGVTVTVSGSSVPGTGEVQSSATDSTGRYSIGVTPVGPSCGTAQVSASFASPYTIPFTPYDSNGNAISGYFPCAQNDITVNFISSQFTTVFLLHGIGQGASAMSTLARSLVSPVAGINTSQFYVDAGFDFSECATKPGCTNANATPTLLQASEGVLACSVSIGGKKLADYILNVSGHDSGSIILLGYSMGGLIARDLLSNGKTSPYQYVIGNSTQTNNTIVGLITLSTPNWGYAYVKGADDRLFCPQLVKDMAGAWNTTNASAPIPNQPLPSSFLPNLNGAWTPASYGGYWLAAGGRYCSNQSRENPLFPTVQGQPPTLPTGCYEPNGIYSNDGVVCADSAEYSSNPSGNPTAIFDDPQHRYSHTAFGTPFVMGCQPQSSAPTPTLVINQPPPTDTLFTQIVGVIINGH